MFSSSAKKIVAGGFFKQAPVLFLLAVILAWYAKSASAEEQGYFAPPEQNQCSMQFVYGQDAFDKHAAVKTSPVKFSSITGSFRFDSQTKTVSKLRIAIDVDSLVTSDRDTGWVMVGPEMFDLNSYEEISLDKLSPTTITGTPSKATAKLTIRGASKPFEMEIKLLAVEDNAIGFGVLGKERFVSLALQGSINLADYNMTALGSDGIYLGNQLLLAITLKGVKQ